MKTIITLLLVGIGSFMFPITSFAEENMFLTVDLESSIGIQQLSYMNDSGEEIELMIEEVSPVSRIGKGTYKVTKKNKGNWLVSYNVSVNANKQFTAATNMNITAYQGSITSSSLTNTTKKATCSFKHKIGIITSNAHVTTTISNGKLVVK
ncbi:DUF5626 family protein [Enterococcus sp. DIV0876]|uniref:DUF5626 family protein n=1 Tax=Enterococcus sp. DIV0876 TaxID=2774633 RepID=UPI003D2FAA4F